MNGLAQFTNLLIKLTIMLIPFLFKLSYNLTLWIISLFSRSSDKPSYLGAGQGGQTGQTRNRAAEAYARQFAPIFVTRYMKFHRSGQSGSIPSSILPHFNGGDVHGAVFNMLYNHRASTGRDYPLP